MTFKNKFFNYHVNFSPKIIPFYKKKKNGLHFESISFFRIFLPKSWYSLKKKVFTQNRTAIYLFSSPTSGVLLKKRSALRIKLQFVNYCPKFSNLPITCAITIFFSKRFAALLGFSKFCGTKHKMP